MSNFDFSQVFTTFLFYLLWVLLVFLLWNFLWLAPYPSSLPHYDPQNDEPVLITNLSSVSSYLFRILHRNFKSEFWLKNCGFDALAYIYFLRKMFVLLLLYFLISFIFGIPYAITYSKSELWNSFNLNDHIYKVYLQMFFLALFVLMFYLTLYDINRYLYHAYKRSKARASGFFDLELNTIRIKNLPFNYEAMDLRQKIQEVLPNNSTDPIIRCVMIPESFDLMDKYVQRKNLNLMRSLAKDRNYPKRFFHSCCFDPFKGIDEKLMKVEQEIEEIAGQPLRFSGNAMICLDSAAACQKLLDHFSLFRLGFWRKLCRRRPRSRSLTEESLLSLTEESLPILASWMPSADDISWRNLNKESKLSWVKRLTLNLLAIVLMIFFTTPASLITVLGINDFLNRIYTSNPPEPGSFSNLIEKNVSPLLIILVNQLLLFLIDTLAYTKKMVKISTTQISIFNLCFIYMLINSFIIPALSMTTVESIFSFLHTNNIDKVETLLKTFYLKDTGSLFVILLVQAGTFSFTFYLLRIPDLFLNYFDRDLVNLKREARLTWKVWLRDETDNFQYGYFYANMAIYLIVILIFSTTVPMVSFSGLIFLFLRMVSDTYELISAHRKEIDSGGRLIQKVIMVCCFGGIFFQVLMLTYYSVNKLKYNVFAMAILIVGSGLFTVKMNRMGDFEERAQSDAGEIDTDALQRWEKGYSHPLVRSHCIIKSLNLEL